MTDTVEQTEEREAQVLELYIQAARQAPSQLKGPLTCPECMAPNDRAMEGYRTCTSCFEEQNNG
jgi:hypothetical protein